MSSLLATVSAPASGPNSTTSGAIDTTGASLIVVFVGRTSAGGPNAGALADSLGNTYTGGFEQTEPFGAYGRTWYCFSPIVGSGHTFTFTLTGGYASVIAAAFSGSAVSGSLIQDDSSFNFTSAGTSIPTGGVTPAAIGNLLTSGLTLGGGPRTAAIDSGFTIIDQIQYVVGVQEGATLAWRDASGTSLVAPTWSWTTAANGSATVTCFDVPSLGPRVNEVIASGLGNGRQYGTRTDFSAFAARSTSEGYLFAFDNTVPGDSKAFCGRQLNDGTFILEMNGAVITPLVTGPGSSTDKALVRWDGTGGNLTQDSTPLVEDDGRISTLTDPTGAQDAATKAYVDGLGIHSLLTADPGSPADDTWWLVRTGTTPTMTVAVRARIAGTTYTIASITL